MLSRVHGVDRQGVQQHGCPENGGSTLLEEVACPSHLEMVREHVLRCMRMR